MNYTWFVLSKWDIILVKVFYLRSEALKICYFSVCISNDRYTGISNVSSFFNNCFLKWCEMHWCGVLFFCTKNINMCNWLLNCFVQNPDIVLVHYLNIPYQDNTKVKIPVVPPYTLEKKEWTKEELVDQLRPMCECHSRPCVV